MREALVVDSQRRQQRGMQIVNGDDIFDGGVPEVVRRAVDVSCLETAPRQPQRKAATIVIAAIGSL